MRTIWPDRNQKLEKIDPLNQQFNFTRADWNALQAQIQSLQGQIASNQTTFEAAMQQLSYSITTRLVTAENVSVTNTGSIYNALVTNLNGETANITEITADRITAAVQAVIESVVAESLSANTASINEAQITTLTGDTASFDTVSAQTFDIENYDVSNASIASADVTSLNSSAASIGEATITEETVGTSNITEANIGSATASTINATDNNLENIVNEFTNHNNLFNKQVIDETTIDEDYWIVLPKLKNGMYFLVAKSRVDNAVNWTMEVTNSTQNTLFRWGVNKKNTYLQDVEIIQDDLDSSEFIQIHAKLFGEGVDLYHRCSDFQTRAVPQVYDHKVYDGLKNFKIERSNGMYMPNATFAGEFHADSLVIDQTEFEQITVDEAINLPSVVDQYGQVVTTTPGTEWQYISNYQDEHGNVYPKWLSAADKIEEDNKYLVDSDTVAKYDGQVDNPDYDPLDPTSEQYKYPVTHLGDNTVVHGDIKVEGNTTTKHIYDGAQADMPIMPNASLVIFDGGEHTETQYVQTTTNLNDWTFDGSDTYTTSDTYYDQYGTEIAYFMQEEVEDPETGIISYIYKAYDIDDTLLYNGGSTKTAVIVYVQQEVPVPTDSKLTRKTIKNNANKFDELAVYESTFNFTGKNNEPVIYDEVNNSLKTSKDVTLGDVTMDELVINKDLHVKGDAFVEGTLHTVEEETITSVGDNIVLRQNNPSSLGNDTSGLIVNNYSGNGDSLELATSSDGTLKVGTGTPTTTSYLNIYKSRSDGKWYSDATLTTEVTPSGYLASWESEDTTDDYIHYEHAVFADLSATLEPIMTRDEEANLNDQGLLIWDAEDTEAKTLPLPTNDEDSLVPTFVPDDPSEPLVGKWTYSWQPKQAGNYIFATKLAAETYMQTHNLPVGSRVLIENEDEIVNTKFWPDHV